MNATLDQILSKLERVKQTADGYRASCPCEDHKRGDRSQGLSVKVTNDGTILLACGKGHNAEDICQALGMKIGDLFPDAQQINGNGRHKMKTKTETFWTKQQAIDAVSKGRGRGPDHCWDYHDADGSPVGSVLRWDLTGNPNKKISQIAFRGAGWSRAGLGENRPLYRLPEVIKSDEVWIVEGEKCVDLMLSLGVCATTSSQGSKSAPKTDWSALEGKTVYLIPDCDDDGQKYAADVIAKLEGLKNPPTVYVIDLPGIEPGGDIEQWLELHDAQEPEELIELLKSYADQEDIEPIPDDTGPEPWIPFPVHLLPDVLEEYVGATAEEMHCHPVYVAFPALVACAAAIGATRRLKIKSRWNPPAILWAVTIGKSGSMKSQPAFEAVQYLLEHDGVIRAESDRRCACGDTTIETLAKILDSNPRGVLLYRDELSGWLKGFDQYTQGKSRGTNLGGWLQLYDGRMSITDRKSDRTAIGFIKTAISITGTIQPGVLRESLSQSYWEAGLTARLLLACPPPQPKRWIDFEAKQEVVNRYKYMLKGLLRYEFSDGGAGMVTMTPDAKSMFKDFVNYHGIDTFHAEDRLASAYSKLEEIAARLALIMHCVQHADRVNQDDPNAGDGREVDMAIMDRAIQITEWLKRETARVYDMMTRSAEDAELEELRAWIEKRGGRVTVREVKTCNRNYRSVVSDQIEQQLRKVCRTETKGRKTEYLLT